MKDDSKPNETATPTDAPAPPGRMRWRMGDTRQTSAEPATKPFVAATTPDDDDAFGDTRGPEPRSK